MRGLGGKEVHVWGCTRKEGMEVVGVGEDAKGFGSRKGKNRVEVAFGLGRNISRA